MLTMEARETVAAEAAVPQRESADTGGVTPLFLNDAPGQETGHEWWLHEAQRPVAVASLVCGIAGVLLLLVCHPNDVFVPMPFDVTGPMPETLLLVLRILGWLLCVAAVSLGVAGRQAYGRRVAAATGIVLGIVPFVVAVANFVVALSGAFGVLVAAGIMAAFVMLLLMMVVG